MVITVVAPMAMLFVRCGNNGIKYHPDETMTAEDAEIATNVLLHFFENYQPQHLSPTKRNVLAKPSLSNHDDRIHRHRDRPVRWPITREIAFLREIVRVPSRRQATTIRRRKAAELLAAPTSPLSVSPCLAAVRDYGMVSVTNLIVRHKFGNGGPTIALNAHGDVVPPGDGWSFDPYGGEVKDGRMYGRGVAVSKSDIASFTFALDALKAAEKAGAKLNGTVELHFTYDEEFGGLVGPGYLLEQKATNDFVSAQALLRHRHRAQRLLAIEVTVHGTAARLYAETGHDAQAANAILNAIYGKLPDLGKIKSRSPASIRRRCWSARLAATPTSCPAGCVEDGSTHDSRKSSRSQAQVRAMIEA